MVKLLDMSLIVDDGYSGLVIDFNLTRLKTRVIKVSGINEQAVLIDCRYFIVTSLLQMEDFLDVICHYWVNSSCCLTLIPVMWRIW